MPIDYATDLGRVRLLLADVDEANLVLDDGQIEAHLAIEGGAVKLAAASALEAVARSEALILKVIRSQDLQTDGAKLAAELRASAALLRQQHAAEAVTAADDGGFSIIDYDPWSWGPELAERGHF